MKLSTILTLAICLPISACQTAAINEGAGYKRLKPSQKTARFIVQEDRDFAKQVAAHNRQCKADKACIQ